VVNWILENSGRLHFFLLDDSCRLADELEEEFGLTHWCAFARIMVIGDIAASSRIAGEWEQEEDIKDNGGFPFERLYW